MEENKQHNVPEENTEETFDVEGFFLECVSRWKWFVATIVVFVAIAFFYCYRQTPQYEVSTVVYIEDNKSEDPNSMLLESLGLDSYGKVVDNEIEVFRSKNQIADAVDSLKQYISYSRKKHFRTIPIYKTSPIIAELESLNPRDLKSSLTIRIKSLDDGFEVVATSKKDNQKTTVCDTKINQLPYSIPFQEGIVRLQYANDSVLEAGQTLYVKVENPRSVSRRISSNLSINFTSKTSTVLNIVYRTPSIEAGKDFLRTLVDFYNQDANDQKLQGSEKTQQFIDSRLEDIAEELSQIEAVVENYRQQNHLIDISSEAELYLSQTGVTDTKLAELEVQRSLVNYVETFVNDSANLYMPIPVLGIEDEGLQTLIAEYNKILQQRDRLLQSSSEENPVCVGLTYEAQTQRNSVLKGIEGVRVGLEIKVNDVTKQEQLIEDKIKNVPSYERELSDIMRQQRIKENLYVFLLEKREENALTKNMAVPVARIIDDPDSTGGPVSPKKTMFLMGAVLLGMLLPMLIIYLCMTYFFPVVKDKKMLQRLTDIPILTEIGKVSDNRFFVVTPKSVEPIVELFRLLRNNLQFVLPGPDKKVIAITSSVMREGKTFISCNVALSFALTGKRVLLIGADIRRPRLGEHFNISNKKGLTSFLVDCDMDVKSLISSSGLDDKLDIIPAGPIPPNPNELLMSPRLDELMQYARANYDYILLDTAPVGLVSDTFLLTRFSDALIYVTRANYTYRGAIENLNMWIRSQRFNVPTYLILNDVDMSKRSYAYRRYGSHNVGYGYAAYGEDKPDSWFRRLFKRNKY